MADTATEARRLFAKRDRIERELREIDSQIGILRSRWMAETSTYGLHPAAFRREVESRRKAA